MSRENYEIKNRTIDSLNKVVDSLQTEIFTLEDGFDFKEHRYEDVLFEYELGISYLKDYHPKAYKDFHRIIAHKERYSHELERENIKRLNAEDL
jgi:exonuclease VII small subunit